MEHAHEHPNALSKAVNIMSFNNKITFEFKDASGQPRYRRRYRTFGLINHSKTLRHLLIYQCPDPKDQTLSTDDLATTFAETRNITVMMSLFDFLDTLIKTEEKMKRDAARRPWLNPSNHLDWAVGTYYSFDRAALTCHDAWDSMSVYACMLELELNRDSGLRHVAASIRSVLLKQLHFTFPTARELEFAWKAFGAHDRDVELFKAIMARALTCLRFPEACISTQLVPISDNHDCDFIGLTAANDVLSVVGSHEKLTTAFAGAMSRRLTRARRVPVTAEDQVALEEAFLVVLWYRSDWAGVVEDARHMHAIIEKSSKERIEGALRAHSLSIGADCVVETE